MRKVQTLKKDNTGTNFLFSFEQIRIHQLEVIYFTL